MADPSDATWRPDATLPPDEQPPKSPSEDATRAEGDEPAATPDADRTLVEGAAAGSPRERTIFETAGQGSEFGGIGDPARNAEQFLANLSLSGLMSVDEIEVVRRRLSEPEQEHSAELLAQQLVDDSRLTQYQATVVRLGRTRGLLLGNYEVLDKLGEGGMGIVFKARHRRMKRIVALKVLPPDLMRSEAAIGRFHREVEAAGKLTHPNIAAAYDADEADDIHFLVMEFVDGPNLSAYVKQHGPLSIPAAAALIFQAAKGLAHAHEKGVVHRDIKPGNLLVDREGALKILDMGLAQLKAEATEATVEAELTQSGRVMGTVDYMSPEQALDAKRVDQRADIYSLGCTLFYLVAGKPISPEGTLTNKLLWHQKEPPPPLASVTDEVPEALERLYQEMVAKAPEDRPANARAVVERLGPILAEFPESAFVLPDLGVTVQSGAPSTNSGLPRPADLTLVERPTQTDYPLDHGSEPQTPSTGGMMWWPLALAALGVVALAGVATWQFWPVDSVDLPPSPSQLALAVEPPGGELRVDGKLWSLPSGKKTIELPAGRHVIEYRATGHEPRTQAIDLAADQQHELRIALAPIPVEPQGPGDSVDPTEPTPQPPTPAGEPTPEQLALLEWILAAGGTAAVEIGADAGMSPGASVAVATPEQIPAAKLQVVGVDLANRQVDDDDLAKLANWEEIESLSLAGTPITDDALVHIRTLARLERLDLSGTKIGSRAVESVARLDNLRELNLAGVKLDDAGAAPLVGLEELERLDLSTTEVGDGIGETLAELPSLREVDLRDTYLTEKGHAALLVGKDSQPPRTVRWDGPDLPRRRAEELLAAHPGIRLTLQLRDGSVETISAAEVLPRPRFTIVGVDLAEAKPFRDEDAIKLAELSQLHTLRLGAAELSADAIQQASKLPSLRTLDLAAAPVPETTVAAIRQARPELNIERQASPDAIAAQWALAGGGVVSVRSTKSGAELERLSQADALPDTAYRVTALDLGAMAVSDKDLARVTPLTALRRLILRSEGITDEGLAALEPLGEMVELGLAETSVTDAGLTKLASFSWPKLRALDLSKSQVDGVGITHLRNFSRLESLNLNGLPVDGQELAALRELPLRVLNVADSDVDNAALAWLAKQPNLASLDLTGTATTEAAREALLQQRPKLQLRQDAPDPDRLLLRWAVYYRGTALLDSGVKVAVSTQIPPDDCTVVGLSITKQPKFTGQDILALLPRCPSLRTVDFSETAVTDQVVGVVSALPNLEELSLAGAGDTTDAGLKQVAEAQTLRALDLAGNRQYTADGLQPLGKLQALEQLNLSYSAADDATLATLGKLPALRSLDLTYSRRVGDGGLAKLTAAAKLERLLLRNTDVSDAGCGSLAALPRLVALDLSSTDVTGAGVSRLAGLPKLATLNLGGCRLDDGAVGPLLTLPNLKQLDVSRTFISDAGAQQLQDKLGAGLQATGRRQPRQPGQPGVPPGQPGVPPGPPGFPGQ